MDYKKKLKDLNLLDKAEAWLKQNPPPQKWKGDKWSYAYVEMPIYCFTRSGVK